MNKYEIEMQVFLDSLKEMPEDERKIKFREYLDLRRREFDESYQNILELKSTLLGKKRNLVIEDMLKKAEKIKDLINIRSCLIEKELEE